MRLVNGLCLATLLCASAALAQSGDAESADTVPPKTSYPLGNSQLVAQNMMAALRIEHAKRDLCWSLGCLVVANESRSYKVTGFFVQMPDMLGTDRWGVNQFDQPLPARSAALRFKTGGTDACDLPVRFVLTHSSTRETIEVRSRANLCMTPHKDSLLRLKVFEPTIEAVGND